MYKNRKKKKLAATLDMARTKLPLPTPWHISFNNATLTPRVSCLLILLILMGLWGPFLFKQPQELWSIFLGDIQAEYWSQWSRGVCRKTRIVFRDSEPQRSLVLIYRELWMMVMSPDKQRLWVLHPICCAEQALGKSRFGCRVAFHFLWSIDYG